MERIHNINYTTEGESIKLALAYENNSAYDLKSKIDISIKPGEYTIIPIEIRLELPKNIDAEIRPRSGLAKNHGITVLNTPDTIDSDYRNEIQCIIINHGKNQYDQKKYDKIAQIRFNSKTKTKLIEINKEKCEKKKYTKINKRIRI